ncbi:DUF2339 domain-containing protein [Chloroflexota bacterium]
MKCPSCKRENEPTNRFCIFCGSILQSPATDESPAPEQDIEDISPEQSKDLLKEVRRLEGLISIMNNRLAALERGQRSTAPTPEPKKAPPPEPVKAPTPEPAPSSITAPPQRERPETVIWESRPDEGKPEEAKEREWEQIFGGRWLARIGALALVIGIGFFLAYAFDNNWIGPTGQVVLGIVVGLALLGGGYFWRIKYPVLSQAISGGGIGILYLSIFAAYAVYALIHFYLAFGFLLLVSISSAALALRYNSTALAVIGILGAFVAPSILKISTTGAAGAIPAGQSFWLIIYIIVVDIGVLILSSFRNWRWFTLLALFGSLAIFGIWQGQFGREVGLLTSMGALTIIFFIFAGAIILFNIVWRRPVELLDQLLIAINTGLYFMISWLLIAYPTNAATVSAGQSFWLLVYILIVDIGVLMLSTFRNWRWFNLLALVGSLAAFGIWQGQFGGEVSLLTSMGYLTIIFLIFVGATTLFNIIWRRPAQPFDQILMVINAGAYFGISYGLMWSDLRVWMGGFTILLALLYGVIAYVLLKIRTENRNLGFFALGTAIIFLTIAIPVQIGDLAWTTIAWAIEGLVLIMLSFTLQMPQFRSYGYGVFIIAALRLMFFDQLVNMRDYTPVLNERFLAFIVSIAVLYYAGYLLRQKRDVLREWENRALSVYPFFFVTANFFTIWIFSAEVINYFNTSLALTLLWSIYAVLLLVVGMLKQWRIVRLWALALLAIPIAKVFIYDVFTLKLLYRIVAFIGLGILLLISAYLYNRYNKSIRGFISKE